MRKAKKGKGFIVYEKEREDLLQDAILAMAKMDAQKLSDEEAATVGVLFATWTAGEDYLVGTRIADESGVLYKVVEDHTSHDQVPLASSPQYYTRLGQVEVS